MLVRRRPSRSAKSANANVPKRSNATARKSISASRLRVRKKPRRPRSR